MISGIRAFLVADSALTTALGHTGSTNKIQPLVIDAETQPPFLALSLNSDPSEPIKSVTDKTGFPVVNINVHADDYDEIESLTELIKAALNGKTGTSAGVNFSKVWCSNAFDRPDLYTVDRPLYARTIQFNTIIKR